VKLSVVSGSGKEDVVAMFGPGDFFGEGCMAGQTLRMGTTTAATPSTLLVIQKEELLRVLHAEHELSDHFISYMLAHNIRVEEDLIDQLFNSSEKRLARTLPAFVVWPSLLVCPAFPALPPQARQSPAPARTRRQH